MNNSREHEFPECRHTSDIINELRQRQRAVSVTTSGIGSPFLHLVAQTGFGPGINGLSAHKNDCHPFPFLRWSNSSNCAGFCLSLNGPKGYFTSCMCIYHGTSPPHPPEHCVSSAIFTWCTACEIRNTTFTRGAWLVQITGTCPWICMTKVDGTTAN